MMLPVTLLSLLLPLAYSYPSPAALAPVNTSIPLRILPLGDSITFGWQSHHHEGTNGYRAQLLKDLQNAMYQSIDFVGTQHTGSMADNDNEGHPGYRIKQIQDVMGPGLAFKPNVVLVHAGTNDFVQADGSQGEKWADAPKRLGNLLDAIVGACPDAVIVVAKIIQATDAQINQRISTFNDAIVKIVAATAAKNKTRKLTIVNQSVVGPSLLEDGIHPSDAGYALMGNVWYDAIKAAGERNLITPPVKK